MKNYIKILLIIFSPFYAISQNAEKTKDVNTSKLSIRDLLRTEEIDIFNLSKFSIVANGTSKGVVIKDTNGNWKKYRFFSEFEDLGKIIKIEKFDKVFCIYFDKSTLILHPDSSFKILDLVLPSVTFHENKLYIVTFKLPFSHPPIRNIISIKDGIQRKIYYAHLFEYDINNKTSVKYPIKDFPSHITSISSIEFLYNKIWISTCSRHGDTASYLLFNISRRGEIYPKKAGKKLVETKVSKVKVRHKRLLILGLEGFKEMNEDEKIVDIFSPVDFNFVASIEIHNHFIIWTEYENNPSSKFQIRIYNIDEDKIISTIRNIPCCNTFKIRGEYIYLFNFVKEEIAVQKITESSDVNYFPIK